MHPMIRYNNDSVYMAQLASSILSEFENTLEEERPDREPSYMLTVSGALSTLNIRD